MPTPQLSRKRPEFPDESALDFANQQRSFALKHYLNTAENLERERRILTDKFIIEQEKRDSLINRAFTKLLEEQAREERILDLIELQKEELPKEQLKAGRAQARKLEETERTRRIEEDKNLTEEFEEERKDDHAYVIIAEEKERERRISQDKYLDEIESEIRKNNKAYVIIKEEEERARRIAEEGLAEELELEYRANDWALTKILEEEERSRRVALGSPDETSLAHLKTIANEAALWAIDKGYNKERPLRKSGTSEKVEGEVYPTQKRGVFWHKKMETAQPKTPTPTPSETTTTTLPSEKADVSSLRKSQEERKQLVDKMSTELFERIARKVKTTETR